MQKIETLKNKSGESIYPLTSTNADGSFLDNGFQYFLLESEPDEDPDGNPMESITGNGKPIWWIQDSGKWVDATGATVTG